ncbi:MAG: hypothetical protein DWQ18_03205 [Crenarchaeota archaeon]|nr:MAG: hypothetical protein DWQ17_05325 [Thermoproteota archaeon]RDJ34334.1 MAG: hypothetical protein DWQ18_03205 [Thermoproteota archaeon]RDJ37202.1 MAG: hypothetical protein DWQ13_07415 [Thermoproteota archaeon]RDJ37918.1 MAG: hypothetical protein DWQ19_03420 [Thermoproteota archaeon]
MQILVQKDVDSLINSTKIPVRLSCIMPNGFPCVLSLWFICVDGKLCCATQESAKIVKYLKNNSSCAFEIAADTPPYRGIRGYGVAKIRSDIGVEILNKLIDRYLENKESKLAKFLRKNAENEVAIEITPKRIFSYDYSKRMRDSK